MPRNFHCGRFALNAGRPPAMGIVKLADERGARIVRAHDVTATRDALAVLQAVEDY